jgi:PAS domain S-box-containing protein
VDWPWVAHIIFDFRKRIRFWRDLAIDQVDKFLGITNSIRDAIILVDQKAKISYWNPAAEKTFGYTNEEVIGKNIHELIVPNSMCQEGKARIELSVKTFAKTGVGYFTVGNVELVGRRKNGTEFPVELSLSSIKLSGKWSAVGVVKDISERKKEEQEMKDEEQRYHALFNRAPIGVLIVDPETTGFIEFNDAAHKQLGYSREEFEKLSVVDIEARESPSDVPLHISEMVSNGGGEFETEHRTKDGYIRNILVSTRVIKLRGKTFLHCIFHDITLRKEMENQLEKYSKHLEDIVQQKTSQLAEAQAQIVKSERLTAIGELAGMIGHDLRNPLAGIKNATYYLKRKDEFFSQQSKEMLEIINKCVEHSNKIISDLLDYSREIHLDLEEISLGSLLSEAFSMVQVPQKVKAVKHFRDTAKIKVDKSKLERVFVNLIKNAIDAMPNGGTIEIISIEASDHLQLSFVDTGIGIPDDVLPKIFSPLFTTKAQGMGFGLAICKRIIEAHGGTINVQTEKAKGTAFTIVLPLELKQKLEVKEIG